jgi:hypothetical protein
MKIVMGSSHAEIVSISCQACSSAVKVMLAIPLLYAGLISADVVTHPILLAFPLLIRAMGFSVKGYLGS